MLTVPKAGLFPAISPPNALKELFSLITVLRREARHHFKTRVDIFQRKGSAKTQNSHPPGWMMVNSKAVRHRRQSKKSKSFFSTFFCFSDPNVVDKAVTKHFKLQSSQNVKVGINSKPLNEQLNGSKKAKLILE